MGFDWSQICDPTHVSRQPWVPILWKLKRFFCESNQSKGWTTFCYHNHLTSGALFDPRNSFQDKMLFLICVPWGRCQTGRQDLWSLATPGKVCDWSHFFDRNPFCNRNPFYAVTGFSLLFGRHFVTHPACPEGDVQPARQDRRHHPVHPRVGQGDPEEVTQCTTSHRDIALHCRSLHVSRVIAPGNMLARIHLPQDRNHCKIMPQVNIGKMTSTMATLWSPLFNCQIRYSSNRRPGAPCEGRPLSRAGGGSFYLDGSFWSNTVWGVCFPEATKKASVKPCSIKPIPGWVRKTIPVQAHFPADFESIVRLFLKFLNDKYEIFPHFCVPLGWQWECPSVWMFASSRRGCLCYRDLLSNGSYPSIRGEGLTTFPRICMIAVKKWSLKIPPVAT